ncbi:alpha/beta hydrolase-fold protein [Rothia sp. AR01]|uniref:Alpha/beta hydrolase-fold protein n=1 Tax=Rothia santali TaxID=2949643 RepID=A0A9X2HAE6_9MICC|nr:alpha/beta hydrolase-fold protein [Rothia santali]MCP3424545.1 alpha/beta hydrolase-fold protein [Rothia santali]
MTPRDDDAPGTGLDEESLLARYRDAEPADLQRWWSWVERRGTPLIDPASGLSTFLWRAPHAADAPEGLEAVHVHVNRVTDKERHADGLMRHVPGTDLWVRSLPLEAGLRASYGFKFPRADAAPPSGPPSFDSYDTRLDPWNPLPPLADRGGHGLSVYRGPAAPPQPEWESGARQPVRGRILHEVRALPRDAARDVVRGHWLYLPDPAAVPEAEPLPLLTLFDAETWFGSAGLPAALEAAVEAGRLRPLAVLAVSNTARLDRIECLGANSEFLREVAGEATAWATRRAAEAGFALAGRESRVVAGQSLGGLSALIAALELPGHYGHALAHSPSMWWTPDGASTPRDMGRRTGEDWVTDRFRAAPAGDVRVQLAVGDREGLTLPRLDILRGVLLERGWNAVSATYGGGHDVAWWRGALLDGLEAALGRGPAANG